MQSILTSDKIMKYGYSVMTYFIKFSGYVYVLNEFSLE